ncbi:hypothetical protein MPSEU_001073000 [Mayamaea pseudoterrestris]|nr:hypothetical protein MPSEU_001073000 [Mayamaea pseudoterrestris]
MASRRYSVTRAEVQALPRFLLSSSNADDSDEEVEVIEETTKVQPAGRPSPSSILRKPTIVAKPPTTSIQQAPQNLAELSIEDDETVIDEEEIFEEEEYEEIIEEEEEEIIDDDLARSSHSTSKTRKATCDANPLAYASTSALTAAAARVTHETFAAASRQDDDHDDDDDEPAEDEESLPDAEDVLEALRYILRQEKPVENGYITDQQEAQMLGLPLSEMVDIMKHFELCDNENAPIRWDLVCLMINAVQDEPDMSEEELLEEEEDDDDDDLLDETGRIDDSDNDLEALDEVGSLGSGYELEAKDDTCHSDLSEFNESGIHAD